MNRSKIIHLCLLSSCLLFSSLSHGVVCNGEDIVVIMDDLSERVRHANEKVLAGLYLSAADNLSVGSPHKDGLDKVLATNITTPLLLGYGSETEYRRLQKKGQIVAGIFFLIGKYRGEIREKLGIYRDVNSDSQ